VDGRRPDRGGFVRQPDNGRHPDEKSENLDEKVGAEERRIGVGKGTMLGARFEAKKWRLRAAQLGAMAAAAGCVREPAERSCPELEEGQLVVSELRAGVRGGAEPSWLELWNGGAAEVDLLGAAVRMRRLDGGAEQRALVRRSVVVAGGAYAVLGLVADEQRPAWVDYGFGGDAGSPLYAAGAVEVESCELTVDRMTYARLPERASLALGEEARSAVGNDEAAAWCADARVASAGAGGATVGTPGEDNRACR
jgi:hypothetical protein